MSSGTNGMRTFYRILGPYLSPASNRELHNSVEVSIQEGKFRLKDVSLNESYLNTLISRSAAASNPSHSPIAFRRVRIRRLFINLSLEDSDSTQAAPSASVATERATKLGEELSDSSTPRVSLVAHVELDGVEIEIEPLVSAPIEDCTPQQPQEGKPKSRSAVSSYLDKAISSLRLSLQLSDLRVRFVSFAQQAPTSWIELRLSSAYYHDISPTTTGSFVGKREQRCETLFHKTVDFAGIEVHAGETVSQYEKEDNVGDRTECPLEREARRVLGRTDGTGNITFRAITYLDLESPTETRNEKSHCEDTTVPTHNKVQQDVEVSMSHHFNISVDETSLLQIVTVIRSFSTQQKEKQENPNRNDSRKELQSLTESSQSEKLSEQLPDDSKGEEGIQAEQKDLQGLAGMMKQYHEARTLVETNQLRGGILFPNSSDDVGDPSSESEQPLTFDTFFDANDQSFYHYKSVLEDSLIETDTSGDDEADFVHTKVKLRLVGGGIRVCFPARESRNLQGHGNFASHSPQEYVLLTFGDIDILSSVSRTRSELSLSISHAEVEDSLLVCRGNPVIGSVIRFKDNDTAVADASGAMVSKPPCVMLSVLKTERRGVEVSVDVDVNLEPLELVCRPSTLENIHRLIQQCKPSLNLDESTTKESTPTGNELFGPRVSLTCLCPSLTVSCAVQDVGTGESDGKIVRSELRYAAFDRCGYELPSLPVTSTGQIGITIDGIVIDAAYSDDEKGGSESGSQTACSGCVTLTCNYVMYFVTYPSINRAGDAPCMKRMDCLVLSGHVEVEPYVPISASYKSNTTPSQNAFPVVPSLSAFKARQEDEEDSIEDDKDSVNLSLAGVRGSHPGDAMLLEAEKCSSLLHVHVPNIGGDFSDAEMHCLLQMLRAVTKKQNDRVPDNSKHQEAKKGVPTSSKLLVVAIECDQVSFSGHALPPSAHINANIDSVGGGTHSFSLLGDMWKAHALVDGSFPRNLRILAHEISFFEVTDLVVPGSDANGESNTIRERCEKVRVRNERNSSTMAVPIMHRSKLFAPISPESPSLLLDVTTCESCTVQNGNERSVHLTFYNMTYRYDLESLWLERLRGWLGGNDSGHNNMKEEQQMKFNDGDPEMLLTRFSTLKLFVSLADCNVDYTSPESFKRASRTILRFGDVHLSSNLVSHSGLAQACKITVNDVSTHLTNTRFPYNAENARLTRISSLMNPQDLLPNSELDMGSRLAPETTLQSMNFITVATMDSLDTLLTVTKSPSDGNDASREINPKREPLVTASSGIGQLCVYACRDSFACLIETISDWQSRVTSVTREDVETLKAKSIASTSKNKSFDRFVDPPSEAEAHAIESGDTNEPDRDHSNAKSVPQTVAEVDSKDYFQLHSHKEFLLDGYDWTTVDYGRSKPGEAQRLDEQSARWYSSNEDTAGKQKHLNTNVDSNPESVARKMDGRNSTEGVRIISQHIPLKPMTDQLSEGDMDAPKLAGTTICPPVQARVLVRDLRIRCRFFDGYDWPMSAAMNLRNSGGSQAVAIKAGSDSGKLAIQSEMNNSEAIKRSQRRAKLMGDLLDEQGSERDGKKTFHDVPLPEEKSSMLKALSGSRRLVRRSNRFIQISASGVKLRLDSFEDSTAHQLASCVDLNIADMFLAETVSSSKPIKMLGEWVNDIEHPRDTNRGLIMLKMASFNPLIRVNENEEIVPLRSRVALELLPIRCLLDQRAMSFASSFFATQQTSDQETRNNTDVGGDETIAIPPPVFKSFRVKQCKLKVDYTPEKIDVESLREGSYVELINLSPLNDMVITLQPVTIRDHDGFGAVMKELIGSWIGDVCSSQMYKFLANATPFQPISNVGGGAVDFVVLPWEALKKGEKLSTAVRSGARFLAGTVAFETLNTTAKLTKYAAEKLASISMKTATQPVPVSSMLPSRPKEPPRGVPNTTNHAVESIAHGLSAASYKVVVIPVREYKRKGAVDAAKSVARGIPVAIMAPISGASEAVSYTLLGARNQMRPDIRNEEEASLRGLHHTDL